MKNEIKTKLDTLNHDKSAENKEVMEKVIFTCNYLSKYNTALEWAHKVTVSGVHVLMNMKIEISDRNKKHHEKDIAEAISYERFTLRYNNKENAYEVRIALAPLSVADIISALSVNIANGYTNRQKDSTGINNRPTKEDKEKAIREFFAHDRNALTLFMWGSNCRTSLDEKSVRINYDIKDEKERDLFSNTARGKMQEQLRYTMSHILPCTEDMKPADVSMFIKRHAILADDMINTTNIRNGKKVHGDIIATTQALVIVARYALNNINIPENFRDAIYNFSDETETINPFIIK